MALPAPLIRSRSRIHQSIERRVPVASATPASSIVELEYINDTGAGRHIGSKKALIAQGWPKKLVEGACGKASHKLTFDTGGGSKECDLSIGIQSASIGRSEMYLLDDSPVAVSVGQKCVNQSLPFVWKHPELPFHVSDASKLRVICPMKYRVYADH